MSMDSLIGAIRILPDDVVFYTYSKLVENSRIWLRNEVLIKYKNDTLQTLSNLQNQLSGYNIVEITYDSLYNDYIVVCYNELDVMNIANFLYDPNIVVYSTPDFYSEIKLFTNDPYWNDQWNLNQQPQFVGGQFVEDNDINIPETWNYIYSIGGLLGGNKKVAVIDDGVEAHEDLGNRLLDGYSANGSDDYGAPRPSQKHGQACAGIIAAQHNNIGVAGIAPNSYIMPIRIFKVSWNPIDGTHSKPFNAKRIGNAITWAVNNGADILSNSWGGGAESPKINEAIRNALDNGRGGKGCVVVFASGNYEQGDYIYDVAYPANKYPEIIAVGASSQCGERKNYYSCDGMLWGSNYGSVLDIMAPGVNIPTIDRMGSYGHNDTNYEENFVGTSAACPHVAGVAALMLGVNPNLTSEAVQTIICQNAKKIGNYSYTNLSSYPYGTWHNEVGYGLVDAYEAVILAHNIYSTSMDLLYIKDCPNDLGAVGNNYACTGVRIDESPDIWIRRTTNSFGIFDGILYQYNDPYAFNYNINGNTHRYVYVRVRNKGSVATDGTGQIKLYWSRTTGQACFPDCWTNGTTGSLVGTQNLGNINSGESNIYIFDWDVTNNFADNYYKCLLARIENCYTDPTDDDPATWNQVPNSNNVAMLNCHFNVYGTPNTTYNTCGGYMYIGNFTNNILTNDLVFTESEYEDLKGIVKECDVTVTFDSLGWQFLSPIILRNKNFERIGDKKVRILSDSVRLSNITYPANNYFPILLEFNFRISNSSEKKMFKYEVFESAIDSVEPRRLTGIHCYIEKNDSISFRAETDKKVIVNYGNSVTLSATPQVGNFDYNWYDNNGNLVGSGTNIVLSPSSSGIYYLEVMPNNVCTYDRAYTNVIINYNFINSISPNPASTQIRVDYSIDNNATSAKLNIIDRLGVVQITENINVSQTTSYIFVGRLQSGTYTVQLIVDGEVADSKNFVKQ